MFVIDLSQGNLEYDVHALAGSFFPGEELHVLTPETGEDKRAEWAPHVKLSIILNTEEKREVKDAGERQGICNVDQQSKDQQSKDQQSKEQQSKDQQGIDQQGRDQQSKDQQSIDQLGRDQQSIDQPGRDQPGRDQQSIDQPCKDQPGIDQQNKDRSSLDQPDIDQSGTDQAGGIDHRDLDGLVIWQQRKFVWKYQTSENGIALTYKESFKRFFYEILREITGKELPWGSLTGIRPTKLSYQMLEEGQDEKDILSFMEKKYFVSPQKACLGLDIAKRERALLKTVGAAETGSYSLYAGIPFCPTTCLYCSFTSYHITKYQKSTDHYVECLLREGQAVYQLMGKAPETVYIGGGTPTSLEAEQLEHLLSGLQETFGSFAHMEFTVEAGRADSITSAKLEVLKRQGVNRISVNPQTMNQETLNRIGRRHTTAQVEEAFHAARAAGFTNINMDIILGLPGEGEEEVRSTIRQIEALSPDSLTVHSLAIKRASRMKDWIKEHGTGELHNSEGMMDIAESGAARMGMQPYYLYRQKNMAGNFENVGYAKPGKEGLYNILIMEEKQTIAALGAGSITKRVFPGGRMERRENVKEVEMYCSQLAEMIARKKEILQ
jgi:oxygen-independent coproporphyrinogen-3 oxidase